MFCININKKEMINLFKTGLIILFFNLSLIKVQASNPKPKKNISFTTDDSSFQINFRFRMQNRAGVNTVSDKDLSTKDWEMRVRRLRLRMDGFVVDPRLTYYIQLSFSRGDMDWSDAEASKINVAPNPVRDAMIFFKPNKNLTFGFGQGKLPGNRQRVISSGEQQFVDRSIVNATFTLDRDFGFFTTYELPVKKSIFIAKAAISQGEGRQNVVSNNFGLAYTGRIEFLPFGQFTNKGDYFEGDLEREKKPKLSLAGGYSFNDHAARTGGQLGRDLPKAYNINSILADFVFKYRGIAVSSEYIQRESNQPLIINSFAGNYIYTGYGHNHQLSYCFKNYWELAARYSSIVPDINSELKSQKQDEIWFGVTKYLNKHRTKLQFNLIYSDKRIIYTTPSKNYSAFFQIELGI